MVLIITKLLLIVSLGCFAFILHEILEEIELLIRYLRKLAVLICFQR